MAEVTSSVDQEQTALRTEIEVTQGDMAEKIGQLGQNLADAWESAATTVHDTVESTKAGVATTVHAVQDVVHDTTAALVDAFNIAGHVRRHPWLMLGGALLLGVVAASLVGRRSR